MPYRVLPQGYLWTSVVFVLGHDIKHYTTCLGVLLRIGVDTGSDSEIFRDKHSSRHMRSVQKCCVILLYWYLMRSEEVTVGVWMRVRHTDTFCRKSSWTHTFPNLNISMAKICPIIGLSGLLEEMLLAWHWYHQVMQDDASRDHMTLLYLSSKALCWRPGG